jgi:predicted acyl esterase
MLINRRNTIMKISRVIGVFVLLLFSHLDNYAQITKNHNLEEFKPPLLSNLYDAQYAVTRTDFTITLNDGTLIDAVKFIPQAQPPQGGWPTVIMVHGYGSNKETNAPFCQAQAEYGYYTMTFSMRGQGNSGGLSNLISRLEANDFIQIVDWVKKDSVSGSSPGNILVMGGSQGGLIPFMSACIGLNVKTIISALAPPDFASSWIENGSIKITFAWSVTYPPSIARYDSLVGRMSNWIFANNKNKWDSLAHWVPIDRDFMNIVPNNTVPLIVEGSWQDKFFNGSGIIQSTSLLQVPFRMYLGSVQGHGGDQSPTEDQWHMNFYNDWYFYWLFGIQNGTLNAPKFQYASTSFPVVNDYLTFYHDSSTVWPPPNTTNWRLYFNRNGKLYTTPNTIQSSVNLANRIYGGLTMLEAFNEDFQGNVFNSKFTRRDIVFETDPLTADQKLVGVPKVNMSYLSTKGPFCQYNFQIFEVKPDGTKRLVNRVNFTDRNYTANSLRTVNIKGQAHSHIFRAGNKVRVTLTNLDSTPDENQYLLAGDPFVLPVLIYANNYMFLDANSYIDLPLVPTSSQPFSMNDGKSGQDNNNPYKYELKQNYPNPFNPSTTIEYSLAHSNKVEIKVYDILGREVRTLVNEFQEAGAHKVLFNASELASGVYFYKIVSADFRDVKRLVLVK